MHVILFETFDDSGYLKLWRSGGFNAVSVADRKSDKALVASNRSLISSVFFWSFSFDPLFLDQTIINDSLTPGGITQKRSAATAIRICGWTASAGAGLRIRRNQGHKMKWKSRQC